MMLWLSVLVIKNALDTQKGANLGLKCVIMPPDPLGSLSAPPDSLAAIRGVRGAGVPTSKGEGRAGNGKREEGMGKGKGRREGEGRKRRGRADPRPGLEKRKGSNLNHRSIHSNVNLQCQHNSHFHINQ